MDLEMTGLEPSRDRILEIACLVTDSNLEIIAEGPELVLFQPEEVLAGMDEWNQSHHGASGLIDRVRASTVGETDAEALVLEFLGRHCHPGKSPLCGNSIWQDRRFLDKYMPTLNAFCHYRIVDISSIKELSRRWYPKLPDFRKSEAHRALADIRESVEELKHYRTTVFRASDVETGMPF